MVGPDGHALVARSLADAGFTHLEHPTIVWFLCLIPIHRACSFQELNDLTNGTGFGSGFIYRFLHVLSDGGFVRLREAESTWISEIALTDQGRAASELIRTTLARGPSPNGDGESPHPPI
jgi:DNA-binding PadR family transcriptional regulator